MSERSRWIARLTENIDARNSYVRAKLDVLLPAQIRALRLRREWKQAELANEAGMKQSRISAMETPGAVNFNLETLVRVAAAFKVGLIVKFVPFSEILSWENRFSQDSFDVVKIDNDIAFQREEQELPAVARRVEFRFWVQSNQQKRNESSFELTLGRAQRGQELTQQQPSPIPAALLSPGAIGGTSEASSGSPG